MRVLVVDDEEHLRRVMRLTLEAEGYEVAEAADGEEALRLFGDGSSLDATLLDQKMPGLDGLETLRRMKERRADACVIMVTAYATIELAVDAMKLGATDFVRKPMTPETLRHAVAAALSKRGTAAAAGITPIGRAPAAVSPPLSPPEIWTTNGFFFRRVEPPVCVRGTGIERAPFHGQARQGRCRRRGQSSPSIRRRLPGSARDSQEGPAGVGRLLASSGGARPGELFVERGGVTGGRTTGRRLASPVHAR